MKRRCKVNLTQAEIDEAVTLQANDDAAWERPVAVGRNSVTRYRLPAELVAKAGFLARLHRKANAEEWLLSVIEERVDFEQSAFAGLKAAVAK